MQMNLRSDIKTKPHSASFTSLQINESFNHFRSVSYFEAVTNASLSGSRKSFENYSAAGRLKHSKITSNSTPCTPKRIEIEKYSTLPSQCNSSSFPAKKTRSSSLSSFFRKLRPKFHRSSSDAKNPWIVIEFSPHNDDASSDDSDKSDNSLELAVKSKVQHFTSLKDLYENSNNDICNCALSNKRKDNTISPKCNFNSVSANKTSDPFGYKNRKTSKYKSESSILFRLSPKRRFENLKQMLKRFSKYNRYKNSTSLPTLNSRSYAVKSESCLKNHSFSSNAFSSFGQIENGRPLSPVFHFCKPSKYEYVRASRYSDISLLKLPTSRSVNTSLSSVLEDGSLRRLQPPKTLSLCSKNFRDQQVLKLYQKMASVESIGACSLDFETSAADNFLTRKDLTASECTLHSNGLTPSSFKESSRNSSALQDDTSKEQRLSADGQLLNNSKSSDKKECTVAEIKLPSYVSISCAINGYTNYSRFCRSRDNSPARSSFRKSSFEPSMLSEMNSKEAHSTETNFRYSRSQSDCNGRMHSVYTESKQVTVCKQLQIPIKSTRKYTTEVTITNGHTNESVKRTTPSPEKSVSNGHDNESLALAKEVGVVGTKSLVQQRIESLYGKSASEEIKVTVKHVNKREHVNGVENGSPLQSLSTVDKPHRASTSPPVFRHLNKDFRKQLQANVSEDRKTELEKVVKPVKKLAEKQSSSSQLKSNGFTPISNGTTSHDECDRAKSKTPPPKLSDVSFERKLSLTKDDGPDEEREGYKFLSLVDTEKEKILVQVKKLEEELKMNPGLPEDASGKIRAACGKANLLVSQKFEQFKGLCWKNIEDDPSVPFYTTASDLAGFWDMVTLQIEDISTTFKEIELLRNNNWKEIVSKKPPSEVKPRTTSSKAISRSNPSTPKRSSKSAELAKAREEARKQLLAAKKKGRQQNPSTDNDVAIFTPACTS